MSEFAEGTVDFRILGAVELHVDDQPYGFGSPKERCVLAVLLYELGRPVATDTLVEHVWGMHPPESPRQSLYSYLSRLRKKLNEAAGPGRATLRQRSGFYTLEADRGAVDLHRFRALREEAKTASGGGDDERAAELLHEAERLWRGTPLTGLSGDWVDRVRARLEEERLASKLDRIRVETRLGRHADLVGEISQLVAQYPLHQVLVEHLMLTLYRSGRQADALDAYRQARELCREETGNEPAARLRDLHVRILNEDPTLMADPTARPPASGTEPNSLPRDNPDFTGRVAELDKLFALADSELAASTVTVVAISGMPGVGKSTFAVHAAHRLSKRYPHVFYLSLQAHHPVEEPVDPLSGLGILLRTLGVPPERIPGTVAERATLWRTRLAGRRALVVLDDAHDAEQIAPLLPGSGDCLVLITCRRRTIELPGMAWLPLEVLRPDDAASLFTHVAGPERVQDAAVIAQVVRQCGYLPLAIHLAGSRLRNHPAWSIGDLAGRLARSQHRIGETRVEGREIAASLDLSYRYLTRGQQRLLRLLTIHRGAEFSVHAAAAAVGSDSLVATEHALEALHDYHLLEEPKPNRFAFHDLVREYAWHRTHLDDQAEDRDGATCRILGYYLYLTSRAARVVFPFHRWMEAALDATPSVTPSLSTRSDYRNWVEAERENIVSVINFAVKNEFSSQASLLAYMLAKFLETWGFREDAIAIYRLAVLTWHDAGDALREARALIDLCYAFGHTGRYAEALQCVQAALSLCRGGADRVGQADALDHMGLILWQSSRFHEAISCHEEALAIWRAIDDRHGEADALGHGAMSFWHTSRYKDALKYLGKALLIYREIGDTHGEGRTLNNIADVQQSLGFHAEALDRYLQALAISRDIGDRQGEAITLNNIGNVCQHTGKYDESLRHYRAALDIYRDIGDRRCEADTLNNIGAAFQGLGHHGEALIQHQKALILAHDLAEPYQEARSLSHMGDVHLSSRNYSAAEEDYRGASELSHQIDDSYQEGLAQDGLGSVLLHTEGAAAAKKHWLIALDLFERIGVPEADSVRSRLQSLA
jgi:DNA-binding SARP family transcriptional activator/tetratricopeptide (TPR) repeat protein